MTDTLLAALRSNDNDQLRAALDQTSDVNGLVEKSCHALGVAARDGHAEQVEILLENGADPNTVPDGGATALSLAAACGHTQIVSALMAAGADPDLLGAKGDLPLVEAAHRGYFNTARALLRNGANKDVESRRGKSVARIAAKNGYEKLHTMLLEGPDHTDIKDEDIAEEESSLSEDDRSLNALGQLFSRLLSGVEDVDKTTSSGGTPVDALVRKIHQCLVESHKNLPFSEDDLCAMLPLRVVDARHLEYDKEAEPVIDETVVDWVCQNSPSSASEEQVDFWVGQIEGSQLKQRSIERTSVFAPLCVMLTGLIDVDGALRVIARLKGKPSIKELTWCWENGLADRDYWPTQIWNAVFNRSQLRSPALEAMTTEGRTYDIVAAGPLIAHHVSRQMDSQQGLDMLLASADKWMNNWHIMDPVKSTPRIIGTLALECIHRGIKPRRLPEASDTESWELIRNAIEQRAIASDNVPILLETVRHHSGEEIQTLALQHYPEVMEAVLAGQIDTECVARIRDDDIMFTLLASKNTNTQRLAIRRVKLDWNAHPELLEKYPDAIAQHGRPLGPDAVRRLWTLVKTDGARSDLLQLCLYYITDAETPDPEAAYESLFNEFWEADTLLCKRLYIKAFTDGYTEFNRFIWPRADADIREKIGRHRLNDDYGDEYYHNDNEDELDRLIFADLPFASVESFLEKHSRLVKSRQYLVPTLSTMEPAWFGDHWLQHSKKEMRNLGLQALLDTRGEGKAEILYRWLDGKWDETARGLIIDEIEKLGADVTELDTLHPVTVESLSGYADKVLNKRSREKFTAFVDEEMLAIAEPLTTEILAAMFALAAHADWDQMPRQCRQAFALITEERRAQFAAAMLAVWLGSKGDRKLRWTLKFVSSFGDERVLEDLAKAIKEWQKKAKPKAITALEAMAGIDTIEALSQVETYTAKRGNSWSIRDAAYKALRAAGRRRGVTLAEMIDLLIPDFGMGPEGLELDVGPRMYRVQLANDLSLRVTNSETGKVTKSLPKARTDEDADKREAAEGKFKILKKNIRSVAKQQARRMEDALVGRKTWNPESWRSLFVDHPVLGVMAQGLIWTGLDDAGKAIQSLRISEDRSLLDSDDETVELNASAVTLWHPCDASAEEAAAWKEHLEDYAIKPFIDQVNLPVHAVSEEEGDATALARFQGTKFMWGEFKRKMEQWDYDISDQDGSHIFGYYRDYKAAGIRVQIDCEEANVAYSFDDAMTMGTVEFRNAKGQLALQDVPQRVICAVIGDIDSLKRYE